MKFYADFDKTRLVIGNGLIERAIGFQGGNAVSLYVLDKKTGKRFDGGVRPMLNVCGFVSDGVPEYSEDVTDNDGLSEPHLVCTLSYAGHSAKSGKQMRLTQRLEVYDDSPFISCFMEISGGADALTADAEKFSREGVESDGARSDDSMSDIIDLIPLSSSHITAESITLSDRTDGNDNYVSARSDELYAFTTARLSGSMFILSDRGNGIMLVKEAPCIDSQLNRPGYDLAVKTRAGGFAALVGCGVDPTEVGEEPLPLYGSTVGVGRADELKRLYRRHYGKVLRGFGKLFAMSNTWGDRSRDTALCETFMKKEREQAERLGVEIMQLDDGWQKGLSANSAKKMGNGVWSEGFYKEDPRFWDVNPEKFPDGLSPIMSDRTELALWFSADGENDYANHSRDAERLAALSREYGVRQFKLDGVNLRSKRGEKNVVSFLQETRKLAPETVFNLDITAGVRLGYLTHKEIGTLFVENRYTDFTNYYPHTTLKNLWMLASVFPTRKFQFELLNNLRNAEKYEAAAPGDELAPANYPIDWLFASVMISNPLFWMEMQHLNREQTEQLSRIVAVWKKERGALYGAEVDPIGEKPDGWAFTGFDAVVSENEGYLILLRESGEETDYTYPVSAKGGFRTEILASSDGVSCSDIKDGKITACFRNKRSWAFVKYIR